MAFGDLFKSKRERDRDVARQRRKAFRSAETAVDDVKGRIDKLKKDRDKSWTQARTYLKDGQKAASQRCVQTVRADEVLMAKLEQKRWVFEQLLNKLELAQTDQDFGVALDAINQVVKIDPDAVADVLDAAHEKLGDQVDIDKIWEKEHDKEMEGIETKMTDSIPSVEDLQKQLQDEALVEMSEGSRGAKESEEQVPTAQIRDARRRLKDLLEEDKGPPGA
jgi:hypothetical protein